MGRPTRRPITTGRRLSRSILVTFAATFCIGHVGRAAEIPTPVLPGSLQITVAVVAADLSLKPVPKKPFRIDCADTDCGVKLALVTNFQGEATSELTPGKYVLSSVDPLEFEGKRFTWTVPFELKAGSTVRLELSNDNASVEKGSATSGGVDAPAVVPTEGTIFRRVKPSVFKVISESVHGSGFLVDERGLVLTNHHVVQGSDYLAVKIDEKRKYRATLVAEDAKNDIAVVRLNPEVVKGLAALPLAEESAEKSSVSAGERVLAVGSPLATETILTTGIVSKIEEGAIYSDVSINPGNSGGPLFNMLGEVIGINTFGLSSRGGPGVSGIVRIFLSKAVIEKARESLSQSPPSDRRLPEASDYRFPPDKLKELALSTKYNPSQYHVEAGRIDVQFITPVVTATLELQSEKEAAAGRQQRTRGATKEYKPGEDFYEWRRYAGDFRPVVIVQAVPEIAMTGGSLFAVLMLGPNVPQKLKFKTDFERMELVRDGVVIEPIQPGRVPNVVNFQAGYASMKDVGYLGAYEYPPEAFKPGVKVTLRVWEQGRPEPKERELPAAQLQRIWTDFQPYFEALQRDVAEPKP